MEQNKKTLTTVRKLPPTQANKVPYVAPKMPQGVTKDTFAKDTLELLNMVRNNPELTKTISKNGVRNFKDEHGTYSETDKTKDNDIVKE